MRVMLTIFKVFTILSLLCLWQWGIPWQLSKQISKLLFQMSIQLSSLLAQTKGDRKAFFRRRKSAAWDYFQWQLVVIRDEKSLSFCEIRNNSTHPFLFIRRTRNKYYRGWSSIINLRIDSRACQKNPAATKVKV